MPPTAGALDHWRDVGADRVIVALNHSGDGAALSAGEAEALLDRLADLVWDGRGVPGVHDHPLVPPRRLA